LHLTDGILLDFYRLLMSLSFFITTRVAVGAEKSSKPYLAFQEKIIWQWKIIDRFIPVLYRESLTYYRKQTARTMHEA